MPLFRYEALSDAGKKIGGKIDAESLKEAKVKLVRQGFALTHVSALSEKELKISLKKEEVLMFTREVARLLQAGLPLYEAISALEEKYRGQKFHPLLLDLASQIRSGGSFSKALSKSGSFDLLYIAMISNAEKTGSLGPAMDELSELLGRQIKIKKQIVSALLYPGILLVFCCIVLSSLLFFVIPSLKELFEGRNLHPFTQAVFYVSDLAVNGKGLLLLTLLSSISLSVLATLLPSWKKWAFSRVVKLPLVKNLFAKVALIRFCRAAATLIEGGLPLIAAFEEARSVMRHPILEAAILKAEERIGQGEAISKPFSSHPLIPPLVPRMLAIAEESGNLPFTFQQIAQIYEEDVENSLSHFATVAQPALLLFLGVLVGFVLLAVLLPLTDVSSFVN